MRKNDLTCAVVRDLLPSYIEGLTSQETNAAVETHMETCADCAALHAVMTAPEETALAAVKEVDYLKTVKKRSWRHLALAVLGTVALFVVGIAAQLFIIGQPITREALGWSTLTDETMVQLVVYTSESASAFCHMDVTKEGGTVYITGRKVLVSPLYRSGEWRIFIDLEGVDQIVLGDALLWQEGVTVHEDTLDLFESQTPYTGDASALGKLASLLPIRAELGDYTHSLKTDGYPTRWTLEFNNGTWQGVMVDNKDLMYEYAPVLLALVENLDEVAWTWTDRSGETHFCLLTAEDVDAALPQWYGAYSLSHSVHWPAPESIKDCADSAAALQKLRLVLSETQFDFD